MYAAYKEKDRVWKRENRMQAPSLRKAAAERRTCRERVRLHRLRKKLSTSQDANGTDLESGLQSLLLTPIYNCKTTSAEKGLGIEVFGWEEFEKAVEKKHLKDLLKGKGDLLRQDAVFFSCNDIQSEHWFLGVIFSRKCGLWCLTACQGNS